MPEPSKTCSGLSTGESDSVLSLGQKLLWAKTIADTMVSTLKNGKIQMPTPQDVWFVIDIEDKVALDNNLIVLKGIVEFLETDLKKRGLLQ